MNLHGVAANDDLKEYWIRRDTRPWLLRHGTQIGKMGPLILFAWATLILIFPTFVEFLAALGFFIYLFIKGKIKRPAFKQPLRKVWGRNKIVGNAFLVLGFTTDGRICAIDKDLSTHHQFLAGTTGSGKTRTILSQIYAGALLWGGGACFVDGKGDSLTFWLLYRLCRRVDRVDDLQIINFINGGRESGSLPSPVTRLSNTNNSWSSAVSDIIAEMIAGMMPSTGGDAEYWRGRARTMVASLIRILTYIRDNGEIILDVQTLRDYMTLTQLMTLASRDDIPDQKKAGLKAYLFDLGITEHELSIFGTEAQLDFNPKVTEQHSYLNQQCTESLALLGDSFRHIFGVRYGEIDWRNSVFRKKITFVMLPALERSSDSVSSLGRLIFAGLKSALAPALGDVAEGHADYVRSRKISESPIPYLLYFDELGAYPIKGLSLFFTQLRGLGIFATVATQDEPGLRKDPDLENEVKSIVGSTNIKGAMKIEELEHTYKIFNDAAQKARISIKTGDKFQSGDIRGKYYNDGSTEIEERDRINARDLKSQKAGEATYIIGDDVERMIMLFVDPPNVDYARINQWMDVLPNSKISLQKYAAKVSNDLFDDKTIKERKAKDDSLRPENQSEAIMAMFAGYQKALDSGADHTIAGICSVYSLVGEEEASARKLEEMKKQCIAGATASKEEVATISPTTVSGPKETQDTHVSSTQNQSTSTISSQPGNEGDIGREIETDGSNTVDPESIDIVRESKIQQQAMRAILEGSVSSALKSIEGVSPTTKQSMTIKGQLQRASIILGNDIDPADSDKSLNTITSTQDNHPLTPTPKPVDPTSLLDALDELKAKIRNSIPKDHDG